MTQISDELLITKVMKRAAVKNNEMWTLSGGLTNFDIYFNLNYEAVYTRNKLDLRSKNR